MANHHRGEIAATLDGRIYTLVLTLGALAELEAAFGHDDMLALADRFATGRISARDAQRIIGAGLRGAGTAVSDDDVAAMRADNGAAGFIDICARLLSATFGASSAPPPDPTQALMGRAEVDTDASGSHRTPFPGPR